MLRFLLPCALLLAGCSGVRRQHVVEGFALGTTYRIVYLASDSMALSGAVDSLFAAVDASMSIFNPDSRLSRLNRGETDTLDAWIARMIDRARGVSELTDGAYDITAMPLVEAWGFAGEQSAAGAPNLDSILQLVGYQYISVAGGRLVKADPRVRITLNSIAKGFCVDLLGELLAARGLQDYLVEVGGEIVARGTNASGRPWRVGIDAPEEGNFTPGAQVERVVELTDAALATSGNYRNFRYDSAGRQVVHIIDPRTGASTPTDLLSATIVAPTCAEADALCTALMVLGVEKAIALIDARGLRACLIFADAAGAFDSYSTL